MRKFTSTIVLLTLSAAVICCGKSDAQPQPTAPTEIMKIKITAGNDTLAATLADNPTANDFITLLPLTVKLDDYASTEKIFYPSRKLSTENAPSGIDPEAGDITYYAPWGNIAIFYKDFDYSSGLVKIGRIESGIETLQEASGSIDNVRFELAGEEE